jgi:GntR family transcriptional regulator
MQRFYGRRSSAPLYHQVADALRLEIRERGLRPGDFLSTEEVLEARFAVSRATVRRALEELVADGLVVRMPSKGTYVARRRVDVRLPVLRSFTETIVDLGMVPSSRVLSAEVAEAPDDVHVRLDLEEGEQVVRVERLRFADDEPMLYLIAYFPLHLGIDAESDFSGSVYALLASRGFAVADAEHVVEADAADAEVAEAIGVESGHPVLRMHCTTYDDDGRPILYELARCRSDLYRYSVRLSRGSSGADV